MSIKSGKLKEPGATIMRSVEELEAKQQLDLGAGLDGSMGCRS
jgi:hypothetical protein